jgi:hypothetical protein
MDNQEEIPEYLAEYLKANPETRSQGFEEMAPRDLAYGLLPDLNYEAQVMAIRLLLSRQRKADNELADEIKRMETFCSGRHANQAVDEWVDLLHDSVYQSAAHSMAAAGMLAPLVESLFHGAFYKVREHSLPANALYSTHPRWKFSADDAWDCHYFYNKEGKREQNLVKGITQLAEAVGLSSYLPNDLEPTLQALFEYRNKMFHCGFEWPVDKRGKFAERIVKASSEEGWSSGWFDKAESDETPWIFYLTDGFVDHCLNCIDRVIDGMGSFAEERLAQRSK